MTFFRKTAFWALLFLLCLWLGCQPGAWAETLAPTPEPSATATAFVTQAPSSAPTSVPTATPEPTFTPEPTPVPTPTPVHTPTPTPGPTFCPATPPPFLALRKALEPVGGGMYRDKRTGRLVRYGNFGSGPMAFYAGEEDGALPYGTEPLPQEAWRVCAYAPDKVPKKDGDRWLTVFLGSQSVVCFRAEAGDWVVERVMICSAADAKHKTPMGLHYIYSRYKYKAMTRMNGIMVYAQYACRFRGHYLFHTVPIGGGSNRRFQKYGKKLMLIEEYEKLGQPASHGCVRLLVGDAYWVYTNCPRGTKVLVTTAAGPTPPPAPALIYEAPYMNADHTLGWDPTDPDRENPYRAVYPEWFKDL